MKMRDRIAVLEKALQEDESTIKQLAYANMLLKAQNAALTQALDNVAERLKAITVQLDDRSRETPLDGSQEEVRLSPDPLGEPDRRSADQSQLPGRS